MQALTLYELTSQVRSLIEEGMESTYWVQGELMEGRQGYGGHFYGELVEKSDISGSVVARARITIWARTYNILALRFHEETGQSLRAGMKVLMKVKATFSELYGFSLNVLDIDGTYTLGDMARRRQEILKRLTQDGIIDDNRTLPLPRLLQRIAVVSSASAAGYGDFCRHLQENEWQLHFHVQLFPAIMQGQHVPESIAAALSEIADQAELWDAVVIIRGGGATSDLSDFDSYPLASCIAQHPLPIITGIGHDRDETVLDYVAHTAVKTPTAAAAFFIEHQLQQLSLLHDLQRRIPTAAHSLLQRGEQRLSLLRQRLPAMASMRVQREQQRLSRVTMMLPVMARGELQQHRHKLELLEQKLKGMDPELLLSRGYSITLANGRILTHASQTAPGNRIVTRMLGGDIISEVLEIKENNYQEKENPRQDT